MIRRLDNGPGPMSPDFSSLRRQRRLRKQLVAAVKNVSTRLLGEGGGAKAAVCKRLGRTNPHELFSGV